jgi:subtilisin family serine protease
MGLEQARRVARMIDVTATTDFDHFYYTDADPLSCSGPECRAASLVGWHPAAAEQCGAIPVIGIIDTGIDLEHEALEGQSITILSPPQTQGSPSKRDHGTAIAALLVGRTTSNTPGLLPHAKVLAVDAFYHEVGAADRTDVVSLVAAMEALAEQDVRVINMSLSGPPNAVLKKAISAAHAKGIIIIAAAGNRGAKAEPSYPAAYPDVIAVTAVDRQLKAYPRATRGEYVDLAAPGVDLWVAALAYGGEVKSGTSYAVPFVTAAAAAIRASTPMMEARSLRARLEENARDLGVPGRDTTYGYGLLQMPSLCQPQPEEQPIAHSAPDSTGSSSR